MLFPILYGFKAMKEGDVLDHCCVSCVSPANKTTFGSIHNVFEKALIESERN